MHPILAGNKEENSALEIESHGCGNRQLEYTLRAESQTKSNFHVTQAKVAKQLSVITFSAPDPRAARLPLLASAALLQRSAQKDPSKQ